MAASSGDERRQHRRGAQRGDRAAALGAVRDAGSGRWHRPVLRTGAVAASVVTGASGLLGGTPAAPGGLPPIVHRDDITLTDFSGTTTPTPTFDDSLHYLLDTFLGVGTKTLPQLLTTADPSLTVGQLLDMSSNGTTTVDTSLHIDSLMYLLGLNNITIEEVMDALNLNPSRTLDTMLGTSGALASLGSTTLDQILTPLGIPSTQTLYGLADRMSLLNQTLIDAFAKIGPINNLNETVAEAMQSIGLGSIYNTWKGTIGAMCSGFNGGTVEAALECVQTQYGNTATDSKGNPIGPQNFTLHGDYTLKYILTHVYQLQTNSGNADFTKPVGGYTIGQILGITPTTTVKDFVDELKVNTGVTIGQWSGGISTTTGSPVGSPVVTTINNNPPCGCDGSHHVTTVAPADDDNVADGAPMPVTPLGGLTWGQILTWFNVPPSESVADLISKLWVNDVQLGHYNIGDAMMGMVVNPSALTPTGGDVTDLTTVANYLTAIGFNNWTLDQLIGLDPPP